eukprot:m51a1_g4992 hypothetical protein (117) ;mRNA; f:103314-103664
MAARAYSNPWGTGQGLKASTVAAVGLRYIQSVPGRLSGSFTAAALADAAASVSVERTDLASLASGPPAGCPAHACWVGHATVLVQFGVLVDPVWGDFVALGVARQRRLTTRQLVLA